MTDPLAISAEPLYTIIYIYIRSSPTLAWTLRFRSAHFGGGAGSVEKHGKKFLNEGVFSVITFARTDDNVCNPGCKRLRWRMQTFAGKDAVHCKDGCSALRERLQCTASEMGKTGTVIISPLLDKRKGRRGTPPYGSLCPLRFIQRAGTSALLGRLCPRPL